MQFFCDSKYIVFPVSHQAKKKRIWFKVDGKPVLDLEVEYDAICPDHDYYLNVERFKGNTIEILYQPDIPLVLRKSDTKYENPDLYREKFRPGFHFSSKGGWLNDPNGLVFYNNHYLLFYQHNPVGSKWGNMHWGHAVSSDLVHWTEKDTALYPDELGTMYSGSGIVDERNVSGLKENENDPILLFYTAAGDTSEISKGKQYTQCMAYSVDGGRTFVKYEKNPVVPHIEGRNRDPKMVYHPESQNYVMALYLIDHRFALLTSKNLLVWTLSQELVLDEDGECPDFYPLAVEGDENNCKWVFSGASDRYLIGSFDGACFKPETEVKRLHYGNSSYAAQTWSNTKDGRRIRITWNKFNIPSMGFNHCMTFPCEMTLRKKAGRLFLNTYPVKEIEKLYRDVQRFEDVFVAKGESFSEDLAGMFYDITMKVCDVKKGGFSISVFGLDVQCRTKEKTITCLNLSAPLDNDDSDSCLRFLIDKTNVEIFVNQGESFMSIGHIQDYNINRFTVQAMGEDILIKEITVAQIHSIWN